MRFMLILKANAQTEAGVLPSEEVLTAMGQYNERLAQAGVLLAAEGLHNSAKGARVTFEGSTSTVTDGPFTETKELIAGFWLVQVNSKEEAIEWVRQCPLTDGGTIEIRQVFEAEDFGEALSPELREAEEQLRAQVKPVR
ncbi:MAG TPA: YciI family protein [Mycobacteriales bacterium]|jgi:hypothetical protein|nr:YciI family protein [Mycobacteriales bacterium]